MRALRYIATFVLFALLGLLSVHADTYWIQFTDKQGTVGSLEQPEQYLSERALQRRVKQGIAIDSLDLPVSAVYRDSILYLGTHLVHQSRWHNGITVEIEDPAAIERINACSFVKYVERTQIDYMPLRRRKIAEEIYVDRISRTSTAASIDSLASDAFVQMLQLDSLHRRGLRGAGMQIAVVDNGFDGVDLLDAFADVNVLDTKDFVSPNNDVYQQGSHGTMVLSTMAAQVANEYAGAATEASYYLLRTEDDATESIREVDAMVAAFEWADSVGADIITSSLGYSYFDDWDTDYTYAMHDGRTLRNSMAATIAARKGILVCVSAGNEGDKAWHYISSPADADSILTVGSVTEHGFHSSFSSYGPTVDGRIKPEVCAMGSLTPVCTPSGVLTHANGTSFSCPIIAGMAACLWGALPDLTNMELRECILRFASQNDAPDNTLGYGIPNVWDSYCGEKTMLPTLMVDNIDWTNAAVYDIHGRYVGQSLQRLPNGVYIQRCGQHARKVVL